MGGSAQPHPKRREASGLANAGGALLAAALLTIAAACGTTEAEVGALRADEISASQLPEAAPDLVYRYRFSSVNADSLLRVLRSASVPVREAWLPLEDLCMDPIGPRFTVVLWRAFAGIQAFDFEPGSGIRACTTKVRRYVWDD